MRDAIKVLVEVAAAVALVSTFMAAVLFIIAGWHKLQTFREHMENAGGYKPVHPQIPPSMAAEERQPSCFALEEEKGEGWKGSGAMKPAINEARPSL